MGQNTVGRPMEILLVEDSLVAARLTIGALKSGHVAHRMTWLSDGEEALQFLMKQGKYAQAPRPDLVLLDLGLPGLDGRQVLATVRKHPELAGLPVVVLTASTAEEDMHESERLQVQSYLTKPVDFPKFLEVVRDLEQFWHADMIVPSAAATNATKTPADGNTTPAVRPPETL